MLQMTATLPLIGTPPALPAECCLRRCTPEDAEELASLYFAAYPPGVACASLAEAQADIVASFAGKYGEFWYAASPVVIWKAALVAAVMTVRRATWKDAPDCPYIIEVFTTPERRRRGLARAMLLSVADTLRSAGESRVALSVAADNMPALTLYYSLGFVPTK